MPWGKSAFDFFDYHKQEKLKVVAEANHEWVANEVNVSQMVGNTGLEPVTSTMSMWRSNQLS